MSSGRCNIEGCNEPPYMQGPYCLPHDDVFDTEWVFCSREQGHEYCTHWIPWMGDTSARCAEHGGTDYTPRTHCDDELESALAYHGEHLWAGVEAATGLASWLAAVEATAHEQARSALAQRGVKGCGNCYVCLDQPELGLDNPARWSVPACTTCGSKQCPRATSHKCHCTGTRTPEERAVMMADYRARIETHRAEKEGQG